MSENSFNMMALDSVRHGRVFRFSLDTAAYQELERTSSWRWPAVDRVGVLPALQYIGPGGDTITMRGTIYPHFRGGLGQLSEMRAAASLGEPLHMVDGTGRVWGDFCITEIREGQTIFFSNGTPRRVDFDITVVAYGGGQLSAAAMTR